MGPTLIKTPESVFEVLWGVAIAYFVVRTALIYFAFTAAIAVVGRLLVLAASRLLGFRIADHPGSPVSVAYAVLFAILSRHVMVAYGVPRSPTIWLAAEAVTLGLLQLVNAMCGFGPSGYGHWAWGTASGYMERIAQVAFVALLVLPAVMLMYEKEQEELKDRKHPEKKVEGERNLMKDLEDKKIPDGDMESEERRADEPQGAFLGENERWLMSGL